MIYAMLVAGAVLCAVRAIRANQLLSSALWLAGVSALVSIVLYRLGARQIAVIELSVGAGLVTVLFVFAISIAGDDGLTARASLPGWLTVGLVVLAVGLLGWMILPLDGLEITRAEAAFESVLWGDRALDVLVQIVLIFTGVLCLVTLLKERTPSARRGSRRIGLEHRQLSAVMGGNGHKSQTAAADLSPEQAVVEVEETRA